MNQTHKKQSTKTVDCFHSKRKTTNQIMDTYIRFITNFIELNYIIVFYVVSIMKLTFYLDIQQDFDHHFQFLLDDFSKLLPHLF